MNPIDIAEKIAELPLATAIQTGMVWRWLFPTIESVHVVAIAIVFGSVLMLDLRLLGLSEPRTRLSKYLAALLPLTWTGFVIALVTGTLMFISKAPDYVINLQFQLKMLFILLAGLNMAIFHLGTFRRVSEWDSQMPPPAAARIAGLVSIACWISVLFLGRWVGYTT